MQLYVAGSRQCPLIIERCPVFRVSLIKRLHCTIFSLMECHWMNDTMKQ